MSFSVRAAGPGDLAALRALRRRALAESPEAFETTVAVIDEWDESRWSSWIESGMFSSSS